MQGRADTGFAGLSIDSRTIAPGEAFVAIHGEVHDGHAFLPQVLAGSQASGVVVAADRLDALAGPLGARPGTACVAVGDTTRALGDIAARHRRRMAASVVAITGSNGKTSTRRMTAAVLARRFEILEPARNLNNQIGVPLTLFRLEERHQWAVLELGTSLPGEIARLAEICRPDIAVVTNVGPAHLERLGSLEGVAAEKGALVAGLAPGGRAVLNADDPRVAAMAAGLGENALQFGLAETARVRAAAVTETAAGVAFDLLVGGAGPRVRLSAHGRVMVHNALAAAAVGTLLGLPPEDIRAGLESFRPRARPHGRDGAAGRCPPDRRHLQRQPGLDARGPRDPGRAAGRRPRAPRHGRHARARPRGRPAAPRSSAGSRPRPGSTGSSSAAGAPPTWPGRARGRDAGRRGRDRRRATRSGMPCSTRVRPGDWVLVKGSRAMGMETIVRALGAPTPGRGVTDALPSPLPAAHALLGLQRVPLHHVPDDATPA